MPETPRSVLVSLLLIITAAMVVLYVRFGGSAVLIAALISAGADLLTITATYFVRNGTDIEHWADDLASQVARAWTHRKQVLVSGLDQLVTEFVRDSSLEAGTPLSAIDEGNWETVQEFFLGLPERRMIILGEPGSGKTLIMLQLVTTLLQRRVTFTRRRNSIEVFIDRVAQLVKADNRGAQSEEVDVRRIPVPISVVGWDGRVTLTQWLIDRLRTSYNLPKRRAAALVSKGYLLPVLDGLDETKGSDESGPVPLRILYRLNTDYGTTDAAGHRPVVLTCRSSAYRRLPFPGRDPRLSRRLRGAVAVTMRPLTETEVLDCLSSQDEVSDSNLSQLIDLLLHGDSQIVIAALTSPLILALALRVAQSGNLDIATLRNHVTIASVRQYFISEYPGSTAMLYPKKFGREEKVYTREELLDIEPDRAKAYYEARSVERWLSSIAVYVTSKSKNGSAASHVQAELDPADYWGVSTHRIGLIRKAHLALALAVAFIVGTFGAELSDGKGGYIGWLIATALASFFALRVGLPRTPRLSRVDFRQLARAKTAVYLLPMILLAGILGGLLAFYVSGEISVAVTEGTSATALAALLAGRSRSAARAVEPLDGLQNDLRFGLVVGIVGTIAIGFPGGLTGGLWSHLHLTEVLSKPGSEILAFCIAIPCGVVLGSGGWVRITLAALISRGEQLPRRPIAFLKWTEATGLLRVAGTNYQFRHDDLREWLVRTAGRL